jgi:glycosyltransferase involved in cell wall biosynthesis
MNVNVVSEWLPYPATSGGQIRTLNLLLRLASRHRITLICRGHVDGAGDGSSVRYLEDHGIDTLVVDQPRPRNRLRWYAALATNVLHAKPYAVASHNSRAVRSAVRQLACQNNVDLWQFEWLAYLDALPRTHGQRTLLMAPNVESLLWQRHYETTQAPLQRWYVRQQWRKYERVEGSAFARAGQVVVVSDADAAQARGRFGVDNVTVVENGIDRQFFEGVIARRHPGRLLFLGSLDWRPNLDAIDRLLSGIFPRVLSAVPQAELWLVGRAPPESLKRRVQAMPGVELRADVADVRPYLAECSVLTVPLRIGGGSRLKILEALATGTPVVASTIGAEGLNLTPGEHYYEANEDEGHAQALVNVLQQPGEALAMAERGRRLVYGKYDWGVLASKLEAVWLSLVGRPGRAMSA